MIGYIGCEGLITFQPFRFQIPEFKAYRLGNALKTFSNPAPPAVVQILPLNYHELIKATEKDGASANIYQYIAADFHSDHWHRHAFLKVKFHGSGWAMREIGSIDLFFDALRIFTGASITEGKGYQFSPIKGPYKPNHLPGMGMFTDHPKLGVRKIFELTKNVADKFRIFLKYYSLLRERVLSDVDLSISHRYFERACSFPNAPPPEDQILFLTISLEALFSPSEQYELSHRVAEHVAFFLGASSGEVNRIYKLVKKAYDIRSKVAHGSFKDFRGANLSQDFLPELDHLVRESIVGIADLRMRGQFPNKQNLTDSLDEKARGLTVLSVPLRKRRTIQSKSPNSDRVVEWLNWVNAKTTS